MIDVSDLADQLAVQFNIARATAREGVDVYLAQINAVDHTAWEREVPADVADFIRGSFRAYYADVE